MFILRGAQKPSLPPEAFYSAEFFEKEKKGIFESHWHLVGLAKDVARPGDYIARDVLDIPIVVRNMDGVLHVFKNVCAHRHSLIARPGIGHTDALKCQYHGWEYSAKGRLTMIPDAGAFRGFRAADVCLQKFRVEEFCSLVFVNVGPGGGTVRESLGSLAEEIEQHFLGYEPFWTQTSEHDVNWKIALENAVESYHVPMVHPTTFKDHLEEKFHEHRLEDNFSSYLADVPASWRFRTAKLISRFMVRDSRFWDYSHVHAFPNSCFSFGGLTSEWMTVEPLGPKRIRRTAVAFMPSDTRTWPGARIANGLYKRILKDFSERLLVEDASSWPGVQRGSESSNHAGVLSAREERVYHFQKYVAAKTATSPPLPPKE